MAEKVRRTKTKYKNIYYNESKVSHEFVHGNGREDLYKTYCKG